ncbi:nicotinate phosphoribosyltransferase [Alphaproteobacteria bacterium]|nr:nicotinate phosphoribosyltransferase [Alphaproteobacteria bacterium]
MAARIKPNTGNSKAPEDPDASSRDRTNTAWPTKNTDIARWTDKYFTLTKQAVGQFGDVTVTYAVFMRRPVVSAPRLALDWLSDMARQRYTKFDIDLRYAEGKWVGAGEPLLYITGPLFHLVDLETLLLQKLGPCCVAAYNAYSMCADMPGTAFMAMDARHCAGTDMADMMAYGASVGSEKARRKVGALGFTGNATDATAHYFGNEGGQGTMPHAFIGYAGSTLRAAEMFDKAFPDMPMTVLVDYFGQEISDSLAVSKRFPHRVEAGSLAMRLDTPGSRYIEGLDPSASYAVLERHAPDAVRGYRSESELSYLVGAGVTAAAIWRLREALDRGGHQKVRIVASSGFGPAKCRILAEANTPVDVIGTGSYLPSIWSETYATADIVEYDGVAQVKIGREFLLRR